ncbi:methylated-DNA--[protein]-cysteine S-methyltransferase [Limosilactobacillus difficilis]|uniref:methylated-DNA--[protein]-cysteine S-methyltransferase n=1 Tax=Limosilactobacillus difficilis TaxID=2991838 RepID=UPI0024BA86C7|nr:methylated-DNA--[protein]-cysteine S-methyltransferase [Limosilactobacillus difficilis]
MKKIFYNSPLGQITILADDQAIYGLWFNKQKHFGGHYDLDTIEGDMTKQAAKAINWLDKYFAGQNPSCTGLVLNPDATAFQQKVYQTLVKVPSGETITYKELSNLIQAGHPHKNLSRAIGNAVSHNQLLLLIPCHRVIGSNGSLTGFAGGLDRKKELLKLEGALPNE